jgi:O-antigen ligase
MRPRPQLSSMKRPLETDSLRARLDDLWKDAGSEFVESPFVGHGPAKKAYTDIITDSEYLDVLKEFGIIGFSIYLAYYLFPLYLLSKGLRSAKHAGHRLEERTPAQMLTVRLAFIMIVTAMVMNIGETTFYSQVLQGFLWIWMGIGASSSTRLSGGGGGIRTHETLSGLTVFKTVAFNRSATPPPVIM